ncbi:MAG: LSm family protein [Candidatus Methanomethyliaceae archaeon]|nr:LSm family protein [Candidatus Methanomethyliaceae archaeon]MCX8169774.1 LSm family protein [Candidatus Methanomethyliaceae archaeon]MDW7970987.1 LSm family protein [Nitrososphaerota archaeon]
MSEHSATELLTQSLGSIVLVKLKGGRVVRGLLRSFDQHLNLVLDEADELISEGETRKLGTIIVRGDNVVIISPSPK